MRKLAKAAIASAILASLGGAALLAGGCRAPDVQIGVDERSGAPIRQHQILAAGDPIGYAGGKPFLWTKVPMFVRYVDKNDDGRFDKDADEVVGHGACDPAIYYEAPAYSPQAK